MQPAIAAGMCAPHLPDARVALRQLGLQARGGVLGVSGALRMLCRARLAPRPARRRRARRRRLERLAGLLAGGNSRITSGLDKQHDGAYRTT